MGLGLHQGGAWSPTHITLPHRKQEHSISTAEYGRELKAEDPVPLLHHWVARHTVLWPPVENGVLTASVLASSITAMVTGSGGSWGKMCYANCHGLHQCQRLWGNPERRPWAEDHLRKSIPLPLKYFARIDPSKQRPCFKGCGLVYSRTCTAMLQYYILFARRLSSGSSLAVIKVLYIQSFENI